MHYFWLGFAITYDVASWIVTYTNDDVNFFTQFRGARDDTLLHSAIWRSGNDQTLLHKVCYDVFRVQGDKLKLQDNMEI